MSSDNSTPKGSVMPMMLQLMSLTPKNPKGMQSKCYTIIAVQRGVILNLKAKPQLC
jgi:hypothetical protein